MALTGVVNTIREQIDGGSLLEAPEPSQAQSLVEYTLSLTAEQRIEMNDSALELTRELQRAGQEFYAREPKKPS